MNNIAIELAAQALQDGVQKLSVGAVIVHHHKILILKRRADDFMPHIYELPGGGLEHNETLIDALKREIAEETNCTINTIIRYIGHIDFPSSTGLITRRFNFLVKPNEPFTLQLTEHADSRWIAPSETTSYNITQETQGIIAAITTDVKNQF